MTFFVTQLPLHSIAQLRKWLRAAAPYEVEQLLLQIEFWPPDGRETLIAIIEEERPTSH
ncbi:hypothetical protein GGQ61_003909 [Phenylobacterium haematophilum]|uniref:Uncharacterized protein n=1 Tax=Phenylobacterium haematophilum TaxID=98513 RepID=A0A840A6R3_9CAUL|nr:hypothetical protein [Phenylobacterium haematophilum]MBB3893171.1 hypothetical protein [Phenylobacterium haematophilum]